MHASAAAAIVVDMTWNATNSAGFATTAGVTADPVVFTVIDGALHCLLVERSNDPFLGSWALPGGFVDFDADHEETPAQTVQRKLTEKTGIGDIYLEQLATYADVGRDPRGRIVSIAYLALVPAQLLPDEGHEAAGWHPVDDLPPMAFDHERIVADARERLRGKLWYSNVAVGLLPVQFTMPQARLVYGAIADEHYDLSNFRRDMIASGLVEECGLAEGARGRPARLWRFVSTSPAWSSTRRR